MAVSRARPLPRPADAVQTRPLPAACYIDYWPGRWHARHATSYRPPQPHPVLRRPRGGHATATAAIASDCPRPGSAFCPEVLDWATTWSRSPPLPLAYGGELLQQSGQRGRVRRGREPLLGAPLGQQGLVGRGLRGVTHREWLARHQRPERPHSPLLFADGRREDLDQGRARHRRQGLLFQALEARSVPHDGSSSTATTILPPAGVRCGALNSRPRSPRPAAPPRGTARPPGTSIPGFCPADAPRLPRGKRGRPRRGP